MTKLTAGQKLVKQKTKIITGPEAHKILTEGKRNDLEELFMFQMKACRIPMPQCQIAFHPTRKFIWDFAWPSIKFWIEIDGGEWMGQGAHNTGKGIRRDREKDA